MECMIRYCWDENIEAMEEYWGSNFTCLIPGIMSTKAMNICAHFKYEDRSKPEDGIGLYELMNKCKSSACDKIDLLSNPLAKFLPTPCLRRCSFYSYNSYEETADESDPKVYKHLFYAYFSNLLITTNEYESYTGYNLFSELGGTMGLLLGASIVSLFQMLLDAIFDCQRIMVDKMSKDGFLWHKNNLMIHNY